MKNLTQDTLRRCNSKINKNRITIYFRVEYTPGVLCVPADSPDIGPILFFVYRVIY